MSQVTFVEIDEMIQHINIEVDALLQMKLSKDATNSLETIKEITSDLITRISQINEEYNRLEGNNFKLLKGMNAANKQMNDMDLDNDI